MRIPRLAKCMFCGFLACFAGTGQPLAEQSSAGKAGTARAPLVYNFVDFPPYQYLDDRTGQASGLTLTLVARAAARAGEQLIFQLLPLNRFIRLTQTGQIELTLVSETYRTTYAQGYHCSRTDLVQLHPTVYANQAHHPELQNTEQLAGLPVAMPTSARFALSQLIPEANAVDAGFSAEHIFKGFYSQRISLLVDFAERVETALRAHPAPFAVQRLALPPLGFRLCIQRDIADAADRHAALEQAFTDLLYSAEGRALQAQFGVELQPSARP